MRDGAKYMSKAVIGSALIWGAVTLWGQGGGWFLLFLLLL